jgi:hypothetical protein
MHVRATFTRFLSLKLITMLVALSTGCAASRSPSDSAGDQSVPVDVGRDAPGGCGFIADSGECPEPCYAIGGVMVDSNSTLCPRRADARPIWCADPNIPSLGAEYCAQFTGGEILVLSAIPGDIGDHQACSVTFCPP